MTEEQYKKYKKIEEDLNPIKLFLFSCGSRYRGISKHRFNIIAKAK